MFPSVVIELNQQEGRFVMNIRIRNEGPKDYRFVEEIAREAFWNLYFPGCHEHYVVHKMRGHKDFIKDLSFLLEVDGKIAGAIFYTHSKIVIEDHIEMKTISLGPVFISPEFHRKGLGRKLITHSIHVAKEIGYKAILTLGYPYHYEPYGFLGGKKYNISMADGKFYTGLLVLPLYEGALADVKGYAVFSEVLEVREDEVDEFDQLFEPKEKKYQDSQKEFVIASASLDE
jgi:predicted N-acetyltransferase YhbS